jgi:hypothetical protein
LTGLVAADESTHGGVGAGLGAMGLRQPHDCATQVVNLGHAALLKIFPHR